LLETPVLDCSETAIFCSPKISNHPKPARALAHDHFIGWSMACLQMVD
jgi:hypothetical protein